MERRVDAWDGWMAGLVLIWGTAFVAIKALGEVFDPYQLTWFRYVPFLAINVVWLAFARRDRFKEVRGEDWIRMTLLGAMGVLGYHFALNWGLQPDATGQEVTAATGAILVATTPLWTLLFTTVAGHERITPGKLLGSLMAFAGVAVVVFLGHGPGTEFTVAKKALVILIAPMSWSLYSVLGKPLIHRYGGLFVTAVTMSLGTLTLVPYGISQGVAPLRALDGLQWFWLVYISLLATVLGYAVWNLALRHRAATELTAFIYFIPVVATFGGWLIRGETVTLWFLAGAALVLWGVVRINGSASVRPAAVPPVENP